MLTFIEQAQKGIKGRVVNEDGTSEPGCKVILRGTKTGNANLLPRRTYLADEKGYFWVILTPGDYEVYAVDPKIVKISDTQLVRVQAYAREASTLNLVLQHFPA